MKFIHAADMHLDSPLLGLERYDGAPVEDVRGSTRRSLENLVDLAVDEDVDFVLIGGDLYDGDWKDYNTGLFFVSQMVRLREAGIRVFIVAGNHDSASQLTKNLRMPENVRLFSSQKPQSATLEDIGVVIHGQSFASRAVIDDLAANYPRAVPEFFNIGLLHTSLDGREGHETYAPCSLHELLSHGYDYWALGHVHRREIAHQSPWIVYPGNTQGRHVRETGEKGCMMVSVENDRVKQVEFRDLDVLRWSVIDINIASATGTDDVLDLVDKALKDELRTSDNRPMALRIRLSGASKIHGRILDNPERWKNDIRAVAADSSNGNFWVEKVCIDTTGISDIEEMMARDDALGGLVRSIHDLQYDDSVLKEMLNESADLFRKLPHEYLNDSQAVHPERPGTFSGLVDEVKDLLLARILPTGGER